MKKTKIIVPALGLLLLSTAASVTGTVAWFAMNASVQAQGLEIRAKSDSVFLLISKTNNTAAAIQAENNNAGFTSVDLGVTGDASKLLPSAHDTIENTADALENGIDHGYALKTNVATTITSAAYAELTEENKALYEQIPGDTNWYYQVADSAGASTSSKIKNYIPLVTNDVDPNYVIHKTVWVTLAVGSNDASNLAVKECNVEALEEATGNSSTITPVKVLVTSATAAVEFGSTGATDNATVLAEDVDDETAIQLDIFLYYNGADAAVYTNNVANLDGAEVSLTFDVNRVQ